MLDRTIPFYNVILKCDNYKDHKVVLPSGFSIVSYKQGYEKDWAKLEYALGDFTSVDEAEEYFVKTYLKDSNKRDNILFLLNENKEVIGSCIAWKDRRDESFVPSLHWLVVDEKYQGKGLGKALCMAVMNIFNKEGNLPIYVHTQPWSYKAILLYISLGFKLLKSDTFSHYKNEYKLAINELKKILSKEQYRLIEENSI